MKLIKAGLWPSPVNGPGILSFIALLVTSMGLTWMSADNCRAGDVLANVHNPKRLVVADHCVTVSGTVAELTHNDDGDITFRLDLDAPHRHLLNEANRKELRGYLQVEIIPADQPMVVEPRMGEHVTVTGAYVLDTTYGWMEIHPAWFVRVNGSP